MSTTTFLLLLALFILLFPSIILGFCKLMDKLEEKWIETSADIMKIPLDKRDSVAYYGNGFWRWKDGKRK